MNAEIAVIGIILACLLAGVAGFLAIKSAGEDIGDVPDGDSDKSK